MTERVELQIPAAGRPPVREEPRPRAPYREPRLVARGSVLELVQSGNQVAGADTFSGMTGASG
jgi:hypothetical protein